jgi:uncharacterized membrane protein YgcG
LADQPNTLKSTNHDQIGELIMTTIKLNNNQSTPILWTPLPECQQELLSGGSPRRNGGGGGSNSGGGGGGGTTGGFEFPGSQPDDGNGPVACIASGLGSI